MSDSSKYRFAIVQAAESCRGNYVLTGDCLIVEELDMDEFLKSSPIIVAAGSHKQVNGMEATRPVFARVLMVGEGYYGEDKEEIPLETKVGDIILVGKNSIQAISQFGKLNTYGRIKIGLTRESETLMRFKGEDGFNAFFDAAVSASNV